MTESTATQGQENEAGEKFGTAKLLGVELRVRPVGQWRPSHLRALRNADFDAWAAGVLHEDDVETFIDLDAPFDDINTFTADAMESTGEAPGKSGGRSKSSTRTRKR